MDGYGWEGSTGGVVAVEGLFEEMTTSGLILPFKDRQIVPAEARITQRRHILRVAG